MNYLDVLLVIPFVWAVYRGFTRGFVIEIASLAALILGIFGAIRFSWYTSQLLQQKLEWTSEYLPVISFALTFLVIVTGVHILARVIDKLVKAVALGLVNRILGVLFGVLKVGFILSVVLGIMNAVDRRAPFLPEKEVENSVLYGPVSRLAPAIFPYLKFEYIRDQLEEPLEGRSMV